jgi:hypothetical protein
MQLQLTLTGQGVWRATLPDASAPIVVVVAGTTEAPHPALALAAQDLVERWADVQRAIATFVRALAPDARVPLVPSDGWCFAAGDCGFDHELRYQAIDVTDLEAPTRALVTFYTGLPDGYATYEVELDRGLPIAITAFAS